MQSDMNAKMKRNARCPRKKTVVIKQDNNTVMRLGIPLSATMTLVWSRSIYSTYHASYRFPQPIKLTIKKNQKMHEICKILISAQCDGYLFMKCLLRSMSFVSRLMQVRKSWKPCSYGGIKALSGGGAPWWHHSRSCCSSSPVPCSSSPALLSYFSSAWMTAWHSHHI